jgi:hypothetical protein
MTDGPLRRLQELMVSAAVNTALVVFVSAEGGEFEGRLSECNRLIHHNSRAIDRPSMMRAEQAEIPS